MFSYLLKVRPRPADLPTRTNNLLNLYLVFYCKIPRNGCFLPSVLLLWVPVKIFRHFHTAVFKIRVFENLKIRTNFSKYLNFQTRVPWKLLNEKDWNFLLTFTATIRRARSSYCLEFRNRKKVSILWWLATRCHVMTGYVPASDRGFGLWLYMPPDPKYPQRLRQGLPTLPYWWVQ